MHFGWVLCWSLRKMVWHQEHFWRPKGASVIVRSRLLERGVCLLRGGKALFLSAYLDGLALCLSGAQTLLSHRESSQQQPAPWSCKALGPHSWGVSVPRGPRKDKGPAVISNKCSGSPGPTGKTARAHFPCILQTVSTLSAVAVTAVLKPGVSGNCSERRNCTADVCVQ